MATHGIGEQPMREWDVCLGLRAPSIVSEDAADRAADSLRQYYGVVSYRDHNLTVRATIVAGDAGEALHITRDVLAQSGIELYLESVQVAEAAPIDEGVDGDPVFAAS
jgi:hypothetical protein